MKFKFKPAVETTRTGDPYNDLFVGCVIKPEELLLDQHQIDAVLGAMDIILEFLLAAYQAEIIEIG